jgi:hypothetical protein
MTATDGLLPAHFPDAVTAKIAKVHLAMDVIPGDAGRFEHVVVNIGYKQDLEMFDQSVFIVGEK